VPALVLLLAACGSTDHDGDSEGSPTTASPVSTTAPVTTSTTGPAPTPVVTTSTVTAESTVPPIAAATVVVEGYAFTPKEVRIAVGETVGWDFRETEHSVEVNGASLWAGGETSMTFDAPGTYPYNCGPHPDMMGVIIVE
jgi:plastocyanin